MSHARKNKTNKKDVNWQPTASIATLKKRAEILTTIRNFFAKRNVLEVETPLLCYTSVTDPFIDSIAANVDDQDYFLQTSPEYAMKRLLAAGSGPIYQISKAFRQGELGRLHNPEFSMLEWYRIGFDHHLLMDEVDSLLQLILNTTKGNRYSYADIFHKRFAINPHFVSLTELENIAAANNINVKNNISDKDTWLHLLLTHCIEPTLGLEKPCFIYDFPKSQAALARIQKHKDGYCTAARFEVYYQGIELANGFYELQDACEQRSRFEANLEKRKSENLMLLPLDEYFLAALDYGLPDCAGVALGIDRLIMLATECATIADAISFGFERV